MQSENDHTGEDAAILGSESSQTEKSAGVLSGAPTAASPESKRLTGDVLARKRRHEDEARPTGVSGGAQSESSSKLAHAGDSSLVSRSRRPVTPPGEPPEKPGLRVFELSEGFRQALRTLRINVHVYAEVPSDRLVIINMRRYREGAQLEEGPRIEAITATGAVLGYRSERFHLNAR